MIKNSILIVLFLACFSAYSQVEVHWKSNIEFYSHGSSNYVTAQPAIDFVLLDSMIFTVTQNGHLSCLNTSGEILWKKKIIDGNFITGGANIAIDSSNNLVVTTGYELEKYSTLGDLMWSKKIEFSGKKYFINSVYISQNNSIYLTTNIRDKFSHPSTKSYLLKYDQNGKFIWKQILSKQESTHDYSPIKKIIEIDHDLYVSGNTQENFTDFTTIYKFNEKGKLIRHLSFEGFTTSIRAKNGMLYSLSTGGEYNTDFVKILSFNKDLDILKERKKSLPENGFFSKENYTLDTLKNKITEVFYTQIPASIYMLNDFLVHTDNSFTLLGSSNKNLWIAQLENDSISVDWQFNYAYQEKPWLQEFNLVEARNDNYYISGICVYEGDRRRNWIKLFLFRLHLDHNGE